MIARAVQFHAQGAVIEGLQACYLTIVIGGRIGGRGFGKGGHALDATNEPFARTAHFAVRQTFPAVYKVVRGDLAAFATEARVIGVVGFAEFEEVGLAVCFGLRNRFSGAWD